MIGIWFPRHLRGLLRLLKYSLLVALHFNSIGMARGVVIDLYWDYPLLPFMQQEFIKVLSKQNSNSNKIMFLNVALLWYSL